MTINDLNTSLQNIDKNGSRDGVFAFAEALLEWMGLKPAENGRPQLITTQTVKLSGFLVGAPKTGQHQIYRLSANGQNIRVRMAVLKKLKKEYISQLVDNDPGLTSYQAASKNLVHVPGGTPYFPAVPYFIHFVTTADYNKLVLIFNQGEQKRILTFRKKLSQTQHFKTLEKWKDIASRSTPEIARVLWESLDIKEVNKEFYQKIKEQFDALIGIGRVQQPEASIDDLKQFAVRLIGRYIFCWFLKEKGVIPEALLESKTVADNQEQFFQRYLRYLFFNTLNGEVAGRTPLASGSTLDGLYQNIPYLNGGLFDEHPEDRFFNLLDLNAWLLTFVKVLESFDFTVDESSSLFQQVAIDPEMLGRIFENLLASQNEQTEKLANDRKAMGAFYTPREIVDYMVNESLKAYLENALFPEEPQKMAAEPVATYGGPLFQDMAPTKTSLPFKAKEKESSAERVKIQKAINLFFKPDCSDNPFDKNDTQLVKEALGRIKILDPACGSGAFPMGTLLRLKELRQIVGHGHRTDYDLKSEILSRNIFGVDIMPMAIEIARLRAWLSLVLDADYKPADRKNNFGIAALPNLDFKFVCANTLIDSGYDEFVKQANDPWKQPTLVRLLDEIEKLEQIRDDYYDPLGDKIQKARLQTNFNAKKEHIKTQFAGLKKNWNLGDFLDKVDDWNPFNDSKASSFFSPGWMFGVKDGFDVVIGNPPYVRVQSLDDELKKYYAKKYSCATKNYDLSVLFNELGLNVLAPKGSLVFIQPNKFFSSDYGIGLRNLLTEKQWIRSIVDFKAEQIFSSATTYTCIAHFQNSRQDFFKYTTLNGEDKRQSFSLFAIGNAGPKEVETVSFDFLEYGKQPWSFGSISDQEILRKLKDNPKLQDLTERIFQGLKTSADKIFILKKIKEADEFFEVFSEMTGKKYLLEKSLLKPLIKGGDSGKFHLDSSPLLILFPYRSGSLLRSEELTKETPHIWKYLVENKEYLENRENGKMKGDKWFGYVYPKALEVISLPKIFTPDIAPSPRFSFDEIGDQAFTGGVSGGYGILPKAGISFYYLLGMLNSRFSAWFIEKTSTQMRGGWYSFESRYISKMPFPKQNHNSSPTIETLVNQILTAKKANPKADTKVQEREIDVLVYRLYGLTEEEIKVVEGEYDAIPESV